MIDVHCHILPGVDDGSRDLEESVAMARELAEHGFEAVIATSHVLPTEENRLTRETILAAVDSLKEALDEENIDLKIYAGGEYLLDRSVPELTRYHWPLMGMADSNYLLVEMPFTSMPPYLEYSVWAANDDPPELARLLPYLKPIIAHPERNEKVLRDFRRLIPLRDQGYFFQVNLDNASGLMGRGMTKVIKKMAKQGLINLVGTDGHSLERLQEVLPGWRKRVEKILGKDRAALVLDENPQKLIENKLIEQEEWD